MAPRRAASWLAIALGVGAVAGCGQSVRGAHPPAGGASAPPAAPSGAFAWLRPGPSPSGWRTARLPSGATSIAYPPGWRPFQTDAGTVSVAPGRGGPFLGYLNLTPRQGAETLGNFPAFRLEHNREEGSRAVRRLAWAPNVRFLGGRGSCVMDDYLSRVKSNPYREIACFVVGRRTSTVIVGAAPPAQWPLQGPIIKRAIAAATVR